MSALPPYSNTGVRYGSSSGLSSNSVAVSGVTLAFDWYSCTIESSSDAVLGGLLSGAPSGSYIQISRPKNGYERAATICMPYGDTWATVQWGGGAQGARVHVQASGARTRAVVPVIRKLFPVHYVTRVDVCIDFDESGAWLSLCAGLLRSAECHRVKTTYYGDSGAMLSDSSPSGRTLYAGSRQSPCYVRLYEKGKKEGAGASPDWVRFELELKPKGADAKLAVSGLDELGCLMTSSICAELVRALGAGAGVSPVKVGTVYAPQDDEKAFWYLRRQYRALLLRELERLGGDKTVLIEKLLA